MEKEFKEWLQDNLNHEEIAARKEAWQECIDNAGHGRYKVWVVATRLKVRQEIVQAFADDSRSTNGEQWLLNRHAVFSRILNKLNAAE